MLVGAGLLCLLGGASLGARGGGKRPPLAAPQVAGGMFIMSPLQQAGVGKGAAAAAQQQHYVVAASPAPLYAAAAAAAAAQPQLPPGWQKHGPDESGDVWYTDAQGNSHWSIPSSAPATQPAPLPAGWERMSDETDVWYVNHSTGETSWVAPV